MIDFFGQNDFYLKYKKEYTKIFDEVLSKESLLRGESLNKFEEELKTYCGRKYAVAVNSGTDAILISLAAMGVSNGDEVIVPAFSFVASATPIKLLGATPIFVDVDINSGLMDFSKIEEKITKKTKGIIVVDLFGECPDYEKVLKICKKYNIFLLEDGAQAFGSFYNNKKALTFGDVSTVSFDVSKVVFGISTAGAIVTDNKEIYEKASRIRGHGFNPEIREFELLGYNSNMSSLNAALLSFRMKKDKELLGKREFVKNYYDNAFKGNKNIKLLKRYSYSKGNNHKYVIFVEDRDSLMNYLKKKNIPTKIHYNKPIPHYKVFDIKTDVPNASYISSHILSLPIHPFLTEKDLKYITESILEYYG